MAEKISRRSFLRLGGVCALGLAFLPVAEGWATNGRFKMASEPGALVAKKWGMVIDMRKCWEAGEEGCRDCILACHREHNVPEIGDPAEEVKWLWNEPFENTFPGQGHEYLNAALRDKPFLVMCNHCADPACVRVCPTQATYKREDGIVMMDYHRCIGCRYCMAACPYGARSFNFSDPRPFIKDVNPEYPTRERGVVEKCNFCVERLDAGAAPACVEACPHGALVFGDLEDPRSEVRQLLNSRYSMQRKPELGTHPNVYYLV